MPQFRTTDDVTLSFTDEGDGPPVVLVAGFLAAGSSWHFTTRALLDAGYRVVAFDRRNHGASEKPRHGQRLARHGKDLHELLDTLGLEHAYLVGGSMGASSIWAYLDLFGYARCLGMVSVDQTPMMVNRDGWSSGFYGLTADALGPFFDHGIPPTGRGMGMEKTIAGATAIMAETGAAPMGGDAADPVTLPLLRNHAAADWRDVVTRATCPVLMVAGAESQYWPSEHATRMAELGAHVQAAVLPGCGHPVNVDEPDLFHETLLAFLSGQDRV
jgi:non-heme chloroperoxidase